MIGKEKLKKISDEVIKYSTADSTQVTIYAWDSKLTRFANSYIHQNVREKNFLIEVKCENDNKIGSAKTNDINKIKDIVDIAQKIAKMAPHNPEFPGFAEPKPIPEVNNFYQQTYEFTPDKQAKVCSHIISSAKNFNAYGCFLTSMVELSIANSKGLFAYNKSTSAFLKSIIMGESGSGYATSCSRNIDEIDYDSVAKRSISKAKMAQKPNKIEPGKYIVILEPDAVAEILWFISYLCFSALTYQEGRSPFCGKLGKKVFGDNVTIYDDGLSTEGFAYPFDFEGEPKQKVMLIERGIAKNLVYDRRTAKKENRKSTGHGTTMAVGPMAINLFMEGGEKSLAEMISSTDKGILVTRFWYTNIIDPMTLTLTGMTRDGTFLIENGKIVKPIMNLRFTQSIMDAFNNIDELSKSVLVSNGEYYDVPLLFGCKVPALKIHDWQFTGVSEH